MTSGLHEFLCTRRSIRRFLPDPVPEPMLERILETTLFAPSAHDKQPWRFVVVATPEAKSRLTQAVTSKFRLDMTNAGAPINEIQERIERTIRRINDAPVIIIFCRDIKQVNPQPDDAAQQAEITMARQSVAAAGLQLLLAAHAEGLGGTWICWPLFAPAEICQALNLSADWEPQGMVFLGFSNEYPAASTRKPLKEIVQYL